MRVLILVVELLLLSIISKILSLIFLAGIIWFYWEDIMIFIDGE